MATSSVKFGDIEQIDIEDLMESAVESTQPTSVFHPLVQFYRSEPHSNNLFGNENGSDAATYNGTFGFDSFHSKVHAEGWINKYSVLKGIEHKTPIVRDYKKYLCPWASIWPPNVPGNQGKGREKITVYLKALESDKESPDRTGSVTVKSSNENAVKVSPQSLTLTTNGAVQSLELECIASFAEEVSIDVFNVDNRLIGRLNLLPNDKLFKTILQPVKVSFGTASPEVKEVSHETFMQNVCDKFNNNSYNQAYIQATLSEKTHEITLERSEFIKPNYLNELYNQANNKVLFLKKDSLDDNDTRLFNNDIEGRYAAFLNGQGDARVALEEYRNAAIAFLTEFKRRFRYLGEGVDKAIRMRTNKAAFRAWNHERVKPLHIALETTKAAYEALSNNLPSLDKKGKIHVFYSTDIEGAVNISRHRAAYGNNYITTPVSAWIPGYANTGSGVTFIYNSIFTEADVDGIILHEIGHAFGLEHPFDLEGKNPPRSNGIKFKEDYEKEIRKIDQKINSLTDKKTEAENLERRLANNTVDQNETVIINTVCMYYKALKHQLDLLERYSKDAITCYNACFNYVVVNLIPLEEGTMQTGTGKELISSTMIQQDIDIEKNEKIRLENLKNAAPSMPRGFDEAKGQSETLENYMDYVHQANGSPNGKYKRLLFYHWQWTEMRKTGEERGYLL